MEPVTFFELKEVVAHPADQFMTTAAILDCGLCCRAIDGMGGPGNGAVCTSCATLLRAGRLRGLVKPA